MLKPRGNVIQTQKGWHLEIADGGPAAYRLAQLDDYATLARSHLLWQDQATLSLRCRVSDISLPGTWGFGFWNDPFAVSLGLGGMARRLPALPNCAWFFYGSPENHLSFRPSVESKVSRRWNAPKSGDFELPSHGFLAQTFSAARIPSMLLGTGIFAAPLLFIRPVSKWMRTIAGKSISEDAKRLELDPTQWHEYRLRWSPVRTEFGVDDSIVFETGVSPMGPLGLVIWIDNQYAAWRPDGTLRMGVLANPHPAWMEISELEVKSEK
jgi:hypothetical protein